MKTLPNRMFSLAEQNNLKRSVCLFSQKLKDIFGKRNTFGDIVKVTDEILVWEGTREQVQAGTAKLKFASKGHIVNQGLVALINFFASNDAANTADYLPSYAWYMRMGTGGSVTTGATTTLTSVDATAASTSGGATSSPGSSFRVAWTSTWNAGTLSAIVVTEMGLYLNIDSGLNTFATGYVAGSAAALFSRLSEADGDFTNFTVNTAVPLTVEWRLTLTFA